MGRKYDPLRPLSGPGRKSRKQKAPTFQVVPKTEIVVGAESKGMY